MIAHTLGNPFDLKEVSKFCKQYNLWLIEDNCDALGSEYTMEGETRLTGTFGDIGSFQFLSTASYDYGGRWSSIYRQPIIDIVLFKDHFGIGEETVYVHQDTIICVGIDSMGSMVNYHWGMIISMYIHIFGYNLKATDMQAAIGCAQLEKFPSFVEKRRKEFFEIISWITRGSGQTDITSGTGRFKSKLVWLCDDL